MTLSVLIVNFNVRFFLEQCLSSVQKAIDKSSALRGGVQVIVVDNNSEDGSCDFLQPLFPGVEFVRNKINVGFAKACNQELHRCRGEYVLFLNPDTILAEDSLDLCLSFMDTLPNPGALGVRMIDGSGQFLQESKRGFPDAMTSFYKMTGIAALFPRSKRFAAYYMGHLNEKESSEVPVLSGAFMLVPKSVLNKTGAFDEQFFMYAEDIDLSYRIGQAGFKNHYFAGTTIIHFKGESTQKDIRYVKRFYEAMKLFIQKHFRSENNFFGMAFLRLGLQLRKSLAYMEVPKNNHITRKAPSSVFIEGEPVDWKLLNRTLAKMNVARTENVSEAGGIVFCENNTLSWKAIMDEMQKHKGKKSFAFFGYNTHALIGSDYNKNQGFVVPI